MANCVVSSDYLDVVTIISNPIRFASRLRLFKEFEARMLANPYVRLTVVEQAFGDRPFLVTTRDNPRHVQVRTRHELWHKENMLNIGIQNVPADGKYIAWIDADVSFGRDDWAQETVQQLQHYDFVQLWSHAQDLGPKGEPVGATHQGFVWSYYNSNARLPKHYYSKWHPGFAWAARREALNAVGQLIEIAILGSADRHMAGALIGEVMHTVNSKVHENYKKILRLWEERCEKYIKRNIGYVDGLLLHHWHGKKTDRRYSDRWKILIKNNFDPELDLKKDAQGLWQLTDRNFRLRDDIRSYFYSRNEDSIDV